MNTPVRLLNILIRICGAGALALGLAFWLGYAKSLTQLHIGCGIGLVVCLWALAGIAWRNRARRGLVAFTVAWGLFSWVLGLTQNQILPGSLHWLVEAAHLAAGVIAMGIGGQLVTALGQHQINPSASA